MLIRRNLTDLMPLSVHLFQPLFPTSQITIHLTVSPDTQDFNNYSIKGYNVEAGTDILH